MSKTEQETSAATRSAAQPTYLSYLLRLYRVNDNESPLWRMSLVSSLVDQPMGFASLDEVFEFLRQQMGMIPQADSDEL